MFKKILLLSLLVLSINQVNAQQEPTLEQFLGAVAGGVICNNLVEGDNRKAASAACAVVGYRYGNKILGRNDDLYAYRVNNVSLSQLQRLCRQQVPVEYQYDRYLYDAYVNGCVRRYSEEIRKERLRIIQERRRLEQQAYEQGYDQSLP